MNHPIKKTNNNEWHEYVYNEISEPIAMQSIHYITIPEYGRMKLVCKRWNQSFENSAKAIELKKVCSLFSRYTELFIKSVYQISRDANVQKYERRYYTVHDTSRYPYHDFDRGSFRSYYSDRIEHTDIPISQSQYEQLMLKRAFSILTLTPQLKPKEIKKLYKAADKLCGYFYYSLSIKLDKYEDDENSLYLRSINGQFEQEALFFYKNTIGALNVELKRIKQIESNPLETLLSLVPILETNPMNPRKENKNWEDYILWLPLFSLCIFILAFINLKSGY